MTESTVAGGGDRIPAGFGRSPGVSTAVASRRVLVAMFVVALAVRVVYCVVALHGYQTVSDADHYRAIAASVAGGHGFASTFPYGWLHPTAFRPPFYPLLLGAVYAAAGPSLGAAEALNAVLGAGVVVLAALVAQRFGGRRAALAAAAMTAVYPPLLANDGPPLSEPLSLLLMLAAVLALMDGRWVWAAVACGLLVLTRPSAQFLVPVVAVILVVRAGWRSAAVFTGVAVLVISPWVARNEVVFGRPALVTSNGFNLAAVYSPRAQAAGRFVDPVLDPQMRSELDLAHHWDRLNEAVLDGVLRKEGLDGIRQHPAALPRTVGHNVLRLFDVDWRANDTPEQRDGRNLWFRHHTLPLTWAVTVVGLAGLWRLRRRAGAWATITCAAYFTAAGLVTVAPPRLRAPLDICCCIGVAVLLAGRGHPARDLPAPRDRTGPDASAPGEDVSRQDLGSEIAT